MKQRIEATLKRLQDSRFRRSFSLGEKEQRVIREKGLETIERHARELLSKRIGVRPKNDGRQTPWRGHPVFVAQHATATCCRKCVAKWHNIPREKELSGEELDFLVALVMSWIHARAG